LIEGHTDDDGFLVQDQLPITGIYQPRATAIVAILSENRAINKENYVLPEEGTRLDK
jgi:chemotaxis protein MotB